MTVSSLKNKFIETLDSIYPKEEINSFFYLLTAHFLQLKRVDIALNPNLEIANDTSLLFTDALNKLKNEIPIQYIIGETEFFGLPFSVDKNTLIPRPETEELVEWIISETKLINQNSKLKILDIGTGSGCIAISLAKNLKNVEVWALDVSKKAIEIAKQNAKLNNVNIHFINADILTLKSLPQQFDIIVSNPPYVRMLEKQEIKNNVLKNEPHLALFVSDENPLLFYDKIADLALKNLNKNGVLFFEINQYLGSKTIETLKNKGFTNIELRKDIFGNDRMIRATF